MEKVGPYLAKLTGLAVEYAPKVLLAIVVLLIGLSLIKTFVRFLRNYMQRREVDPTLQPFLAGLASIVLKAALLISVAGIVGIQTTSFVAVLGAAGLAVGLALQGSMSNFAGGVLLLIFKPFKVGDYVEAQGFSGTGVGNRHPQHGLEDA